MKKFLCLLVLVAVLFVGCSDNRKEVSIGSKDASSSVGDVEVSASSKDSPSSASKVETDLSADDFENANSHTGGGDDLFCVAHQLMYHSVSNTLIQYVGQELFDAWVETVEPAEGNCGKWTQEEFTIVNFVKYFQIPKETFISVTRDHLTEAFLKDHDGITVYSLEQIDAIYSGDKRLINEAFGTPLSLVNDADDELYSIYWLANHTAEDYIAAKLPLDRVAVILETAALPEFDERYDLIEKIEPQLERARELEKAAAAK